MNKTFFLAEANREKGKLNIKKEGKKTNEYVCLCIVKING